MALYLKHTFIRFGKYRYLNVRVRDLMKTDATFLMKAHNEEDFFELSHKIVDEVRDLAEKEKQNKSKSRKNY